MTIFGDRIERRPITSAKDFSRSRRITTKIENGGFPAREGLERIYLGEDENYNLATGPYMKSISTVASLVGIPQIPRHENPVVQKQRKRLQKLINDEWPIAIKLAMINGTHWIFPYYAAGRNIIDHIKDYEFPEGSVRINPRTKEILSINIEQWVHWYRDSTDYFQMPDRVLRKRYFSREKIVESFDGDVKELRNPFGIMPIPFAVDSLGDWRGNSFITPILRLAGDSHRIRANRDEILATYKPQAVVNTDNWKQWAAENAEASGLDDDATYDIFETQAKFCKTGENYQYAALPGGVVADHNTALQDNDTQIQLSEKMPFIYSGAESRGNHATGIFQQEQGVFFVQNIRDQFYKAAYALLNALNKQDSFIEGIEAEEIEVNYSRMELMSDEQRVNVLSSAMATIGQMESSGIPMEVGFSTLKKLFDFSYQTPQELQDAIRELKENMPVQDDFSSMIGDF